MVGRHEEREDITVTFNYTLLKRRKYYDQFWLSSESCATVAKGGGGLGLVFTLSVSETSAASI